METFVSFSFFVSLEENGGDLEASDFSNLLTMTIKNLETKGSRANSR
jgi:hypothetical protein